MNERGEGCVLGCVRGAEGGHEGGHALDSYSLAGLELAVLEIALTGLGLLKVLEQSGRGKLPDRLGPASSVTPTRA